MMTLVSVVWPVTMLEQHWWTQGECVPGVDLVPGVCVTPTYAPVLQCSSASISSGTLVTLVTLYTCHASQLYLTTSHNTASLSVRSGQWSVKIAIY